MELLPYGAVRIIDKGWEDRVTGMGSIDIFNTIANLFFSAAAAGTLVFILFFVVTRIMKKDDFDGVILKLTVILAVLWFLDIGLYIYLSIVYKV